MLIPSRTTVALLAVPLGLGFAAALVSPVLLWPMLAVDGAIVLALAIDALLDRRPVLSVRRDVGTGVFSVGRPNVVTLELRSRARVPLELELVDGVFQPAELTGLPARVHVPAHGSAVVQYRVTPHRRGQFALGEHWIRHASPLGLWIRQRRIAAKSEIRVYPDVEAVRTYELLARQNREHEMIRATRMRGGESEFECLREYGHGDEYRAIDWKATAHKRKLIARQFQLERNQSIVFALDCGRLMTAHVAELPLFDHALNSALMLGHVALKSGDHVGLLAFSDRVERFVAPTSGADTARRMLRATFDLHAGMTESNVQAAFVRVGAQLRKRSLLVILTQVIDDVAAGELVRTVRSLHPRHLPLCVLFRDPDLERLAVDPGGDPYVAAAAAELLAWRDRVLRQLKRSGALVLDVSPRELTPALIRRYLDVKIRRLL